MSVIKLENNCIELQVNLNGGSYFDFHFKDLPVNPINWVSKDPEYPPFMGHFLCFDRWGPPTEAEKTNGLKHHGEVNTQVWKVLNETQNIEGFTTSLMRCSLPVVGLQLTRKIELSENEPIFFVTEEIKNLNKDCRIFNIVQHVTLAPPFLNQSTFIDNNTEKGFEDKADGGLNQEEPILKWPEANRNTEKVSLRQIQNEWPTVSSFVFHENDKYGWVTACNATQNLMLGYIWQITDYPWINFWRSLKDGVPMAFGMEFGTTGLHEPLPLVVKKKKIFGRNIFAVIDSGEVVHKSFMAFLAKIPADYKGVEQIKIHNSIVTIKEKNKISRDIKYHINKLKQIYET